MIIWGVGLVRWLDFEAVLSGGWICVGRFFQECIYLQVCLLEEDDH